MFLISMLKLTSVVDNTAEQFDSSQSRTCFSFFFLISMLQLICTVTSPSDTQADPVYDLSLKDDQIFKLEFQALQLNDQYDEISTLVTILDLKAENLKLRAERLRLKDENLKLKDENFKFKDTITKLEITKHTAHSLIGLQKDLICELRADVVQATMKMKIAAETISIKKDENRRLLRRNLHLTKQSQSFETCFSDLVGNVEPLLPVLDKGGNSKVEQEIGRARASTV
jgi:hypothetical protein